MEISSKIKVTFFFIMSLQTLLTAVSFDNNFYLNLIRQRAKQHNNYITPRDMHLLTEIMPYLLVISKDNDVDPVIFITFIEKESSFKWTYGDNGDSGGFFQLGIRAQDYVVKRYSDYLYEIGITNLKFSNTHDLYITPIRNSCIQMLYFIHHLHNTNTIVEAIGRYNGINNDEYINDFIERYMENKILEHTLIEKGEQG